MQAGLLQPAVAHDFINYIYFYFSRKILVPARISLVVCVGLLAVLTWLPVAEAGELPEYDRVRIIPSAPRIADAELTDQNGEPFQLSRLRGRVALLFFGFSSCPDVCPMGLEYMRQLASSGQLDSDKVAYLMISVDGDRDTPAIMKAYLKDFSPIFIGLTGEPEQVKKIAKNFSAAFFKGSINPEDGKYLVTHSPQIFVVDPAGRLRAEFYNASIPAMAGITQALISEAQMSEGTMK